MFDATRFKTLMLREWLQNRWTWLIAIAALPVLTLVSLPFGEMQLGDKQVPGAALMLIPLAATPLVCVMIAWLTTLFMASGLARRDWQDRSIEFWMSLPSTHAEHIGAQYLMHAFVFPLLALVLGIGLGLLLVPVALLKMAGHYGAVPVGEVLSVMSVPLLLAVPALLIGALWMSPIVLTVMAASVWLKRLALPILAVIAVFLANFPSTRGTVRAFAADYAARIGQLFEGLVGVVAMRAGETLELGKGDGPRPTDAAGYFGEVLGNMASLPFALGIAVALLACVAITAKRRRG